MVQDKRPVQADDIYRIVTVEEPQVSPDGQWIAFVRVTRDQHRNKTRQSIWVVHPDGSRLRQFTSGDAQDSMPRWSPDSRQLAFVSDRSGKPQLYVIPVDGGEAQRLTYMANGASTPDWSPDGKSIAFLSPMRPDEIAAEDEEESLPPANEAELDEFLKKIESDDNDRFDPRVVDRLPFRTGTTFWDERFKHIYIVPADVEQAHNRRPQRLTHDARDYQPPRWSADGQSVFSITSRQPEHDAAWLFNAVVEISIENGEIVERVGEGWSCDSVKPSPDGQWLAFLTRPDTLPTNRFSHLAIVPANGGTVQVLTETFDRALEQFDWLPDSRSLIFTARVAGAVPLYRVSLDEPAPELLAHTEATVTGIGAGGGVVASAAFTPDALHEIYAVTDAESKQITAFNAAYLEEVWVAEFEPITYESEPGVQIDGWLLRPLDYQEGSQFPLGLNIHGGPSAMWGASTPTMWLEWQHHAANGYVVFFCNPRGSTGYSEAFMLSNQGDWGHTPARDVLAGVDILLERGIVDPGKLAITGGSYGGYLTAWIIGYDTRFAAAVAQRGVYHLLAFHGTTDIPLFMSSNVQAEPWDDPEAFWKLSPLAYAQDIQTPLLIIHSENDFRVPIAEGEQLYTTLKRLGRTVQMVRYPREGHELSRSGEPKHIIDRLDRIVEWWDRYCKKT